MRTITFVFVLFSVVGSHSQSRSGFEDLEKSIKEKIAKREMPSIALAVSKNGRTVYENAFGKADIANNVRATTNTSYQIASVSKPLTATAIMILDKRNVIDIDKNAEEYMDGLRFKNHFNVDGTVSIRNLLNHTSGLGTYFDIYYVDEDRTPVPFEDAFDTFGVLHHSPNVVSEYSNLGYGLLDHIISKNSGETFHGFLREALFKPLGMDNSYVQGHKKGLKNVQEAKKYSAELEELPEVLNNTPGAGNIYTSVSDLIKFGNFHVNKGNAKVLSPKTLSEMHDHRNPSTLYHYHQDAFYGLGWYVKPNDNGYRILWHEGGMMGASATLKLIPEEDVVIAVIINSSNRAVCNEVVDELTKIMVPTYTPTPLNESTEIAAYKPVAEDQSFLGKWSGTMTIDSLDIPISLAFEENGTATVCYLDHTYKSYFTQDYPLLNRETLTMAISNQNSFIGLFLGTLPYENLRKEYSHLLSLKLFKQTDTLTGTVVALAAADREYYAYPFHIELMKED